MSGEEFSQDAEGGEGDVESAGSDSDESDLGARRGVPGGPLFGEPECVEEGLVEPVEVRNDEKMATSLITSRLRRLHRLMVILPRHYLSAAAGIP